MFHGVIYLFTYLLTYSLTYLLTYLLHIFQMRPLSFYVYHWPWCLFISDANSLFQN